MDIIQWIIIIGLVVFIISRFLPVKGVENITVAEAKEKTNDKNIQFIDVRTPNEFNHFHTKPFQNMPLSHLHALAPGLETDKEVVIICQSGMRSKRAGKTLKKLGFEKICNVKGGMSAWT